MPRVLLSGKLHDDGMAVLRARADVTIVADGRARTRPSSSRSCPTRTRSSSAPRCCRARRWSMPRRLKVVSRHGVGYDNVPVDALTEKGVPLAVVGGIHSGTVAEHAMFLMLALAKAGAPPRPRGPRRRLERGAGTARGVRACRADAAPHRLRPHRPGARGPRPGLRDDGARLRPQRPGGRHGRGRRRQGRGLARGAAARSTSFRSMCRGSARPRT